jgi:hypothetical protein
MVPLGTSSSQPPTAVFFYEQTASALIDAVRSFQQCQFNPSDLVKHASNLSVPLFQERIRKSVLAVKRNHSPATLP